MYPLPVIGSVRPAEMAEQSGEPGSDPVVPWNRFLTERENLTKRMEMETCNGCDGCGLRCMEGFTVTLDEWRAIQSYLEKQPPGEVDRVQQQEKTVPWPGAEETGCTVTYCQFRDMEQNRCSIYPVRPTICRLFGHTAWLPCPIAAVEPVPEGAEQLWNRYRKFERRTFAGWEASADDR